MINIKSETIQQQESVIKTKETFFVISGIADIDIASNQSMKNTLKHLSSFGYCIHVFAAFPKNYPILQNPEEVFNSNVIFHRSPNFLIPVFNFAKKVKDFFGRADKKKDQAPKKLDPNNKTSYYDEYNFFGRMFFAFFLFIYVPIELIRVLFYFGRLKPKLFYGINDQGSAVCSILGKFLKIPVIHRWHGVSHTEEDVAKMKTSFKHKLLLLDGSFARMMHNDALVVTNDGTRGDEIFPLMGIDPKKIYYWRNGFDVDELYLENDWNAEEFKKSLGIEGKKIALTASRLVLWKRVDRALESLHRLITQYEIKDMVLLIVGNGREEIRLKQIAKDLNIEEHVKFLGSVPHCDMAKYYSIADMFLSFYEISNLGNPLIEAMYFGLPIVTLRDSGSIQLVEDGANGFMLEAETLDQEAPKKMQLLLSDETLREKMGNRSKQIFDEKMLSWKDRMAKEDDLIQKLILKYQ